MHVNIHRCDDSGVVGVLSRNGVLHNEPLPFRKDCRSVRLVTEG